MVRHPAFGYATKEEIDRIMSMGVSYQRDYLINEIKKRNERKGKKNGR